MIGIYDPNAGKGYVVIDATRGVIGGTLRLPEAISAQLGQRNPRMDAKLPAFSGNPLEFMAEVETVLRHHWLQVSLKPTTAAA